MADPFRKGVEKVMMVGRFSGGRDHSDRTDRGPNPHKTKKRDSQPDTEPPPNVNWVSQPTSGYYTSHNESSYSSGTGPQSHSGPFQPPHNSQYGSPTGSNYYPPAQHGHDNAGTSYQYQQAQQQQHYTQPHLQYGPGTAQQPTATVASIIQQAGNQAWDQGPRLESQTQYQGPQQHPTASWQPYENYTGGGISPPASGVPRSEHKPGRSATADLTYQPHPPYAPRPDRAHSLADPTFHGQQNRQQQQQQHSPSYTSQYGASVYSEPGSDGRHYAGSSSWDGQY